MSDTEPLPDPALVAAAVAQAGSEPAAALRSASRALAAAQLSAAMRIDATKASAVARLQAGDLSGALQDIRRAIAMSAQAGDHGRQARCLVNLGIMQAQSGHPAEALAAYREAMTLAGRSSEAAAIAFCNLGLLAEDLGEPDLALLFSRRGCELLPPGPARAGASLNVGTYLLRLGRPLEAIPLLQAAVEEAGSMRLYALNARAALAWAQGIANAPAQGEAALQQVIDDADAAGLAPSALRARLLLGELRLNQGRSAEAVTMGLACAEALEHQGSAAMARELSRWLPRALAAEQRWREASEWHERHLALQPRGADGHPVRRDLFRMADDIFGQPVSPLAPPGYQPVPHLAQRHGLTERDADILCGVVCGLGNAEIASTMGLSTHTVRNRLSRAMKRLAVGTRTAAARRAMELGLVRPVDGAGRQDT